MSAVSLKTPPVSDAPPPPPSGSKEAKEKESKPKEQHKAELSPDEKARRAAFLNTREIILPRKIQGSARELPPLELCPNDLLFPLMADARIRKRLVIEQKERKSLLAKRPAAIIGSGATQIKDPRLYAGDKDFLIPVSIPSFGPIMAKRKFNQILGLFINTIKEQIQGIDSTVLPEEDKMCAKVIRSHYLKTSILYRFFGNQKVSTLSSIGIGRFQFKFLSEEHHIQDPDMPQSTSEIDGFQIAIDEGWSTCVNGVMVYDKEEYDQACKNLAMRVCFMASPEKISKLFLRHALDLTRGWLVLFQQKIQQIALDGLKTRYPLDAKDSKLPNLFRAYLINHYSESLVGRTALLVNMLHLLKSLSPKDVQEYSQIALRAACRQKDDSKCDWDYEDPLAAFLSNKTTKEIQEVLLWLQGIFLYEWTLNNPSILAYPLDPAFNNPALAKYPTAPAIPKRRFEIGLKIGDRFYATIVLDKSPLALASALVRSWNALEQAYGKDAKSVEALNGILRHFKFTLLTFSFQSKRHVLDQLFKATNSVPMLPALKDFGENPEDLRLQMTKLFEDSAFRQQVWTDNLEKALQTARKDLSEKEWGADLNACESHGELTEDQVQQLTRRFLEIEEISPSLKSVLVPTLLLLLQRSVQQRTLSNVQILQKAFIALIREQLLSKNEKNHVLNLLVEFYSAPERNPNHPTYLTAVHEFLLSSSSWVKPHKHFEEVSGKLTNSLLAMLPPLLSDLRNPDKEKMVYQTLRVFMKILSPEEAMRHLPAFLNKLLLSAVETNYRLSILRINECISLLMNPDGPPYRLQLLESILRPPVRLLQLIEGLRFSDKKLKAEHEERRYQLLELLSRVPDKAIQEQLQRQVLIEIRDIFLNPSENAQEKLKRLTPLLPTEMAKKQFVGILAGLEVDNPNQSLIRFFPFLMHHDLNLAEGLVPILHEVVPAKAKRMTLILIQALMLSKSKENYEKAYQLHQKWISPNLDSNLNAMGMIQAMNLVALLNQNFAKRASEELLSDLLKTLKEGVAHIHKTLNDMPPESVQKLQQTMLDVVKTTIHTKHTRAKAIELCLSLVDCRLLPPETIQEVYKALLQHAAMLSTEERNDTLIQVLKSRPPFIPDRDSLSLLEGSYLAGFKHSLKQMGEKEKAGKELPQLAEELFDLLIDTNILQKLNLGLQLEVCKYLLISNKTRSFLRAWVCIQDYKAIPRVDAEGFAEIFSEMKNVRFLELIQELFAASDHKNLVLYRNFLTGCVLFPQKAFFNAVIRDMNRILEEAEKERKMNQGIDDRVAPLFLLLFQYTAQLAYQERLRPTGLFTDALEPFIVHARHFVGTHQRDKLLDLNNEILSLFMNGQKTVEMIKRVASFCLQDGIQQAGKAAIYVFSNLLSLPAEQQNRDLDRLMIALMKKALIGKWIVLDSPEDALLYQEFKNRRHYQDLHKLDLIFRVFKLSLKPMNLQLKEAAKKLKGKQIEALEKRQLQKHGEILKAVMNAFITLGNYRHIGIINRLLRHYDPIEHFAQKAAIHHTLLGLQHQLVKNMADEKVAKELLGHFETLLPAYITYLPDSLAKIINLFTTYGILHDEGRWMSDRVDALATSINSMQQRKIRHSEVAEKELQQILKNFEYNTDLGLLELLVLPHEGYYLKKAYKYFKSIITDLREPSRAVKATLLLHQRILMEMLINHQCPKDSMKVISNAYEMFLKASPKPFSNLILLMMLQSYYCLYLRKRCQEGQGTQEESVTEQHRYITSPRGVQELWNMLSNKGIRCVPQEDLKVITSFFQTFTKEGWAQLLKPKVDELFLEWIKGLVTVYFKCSSSHFDQIDLASGQHFRFAVDGLFREVLSEGDYSAFQKTLDSVGTEWEKQYREHSPPRVSEGVSPMLGHPSMDYKELARGYLELVPAGSSKPVPVPFTIGIQHFKPASTT